MYSKAFRALMIQKMVDPEGTSKLKFTPLKLIGVKAIAAARTVIVEALRIQWIKPEMPSSFAADGKFIS